MSVLVLRVLVKAIFRPSGDQDGSVSSKALFVSRSSPVPSGLTEWISVVSGSTHRFVPHGSPCILSKAILPLVPGGTASARSGMSTNTERAVKLAAISPPRRRDELITPWLLGHVGLCGQPKASVVPCRQMS